MKVVNFESLGARVRRGLKCCVINSVSVLSLTMLIPAGLSHGGDFGAADLEGAQGEAGGDAGFDAGAGFDGGAGADQMGAAGLDAGFDAGGALDAGAASGPDVGADTYVSDQFGGAEFPPEEALTAAIPAAAFPAALPAQVKAVDASLKVYFDELEDALLLGDLAQLRKVCQSKSGDGCGEAKNFLSACTLFLREEGGFGASVCIQRGSERYKMNPEGFVYPANPLKNKPEQSAMDHLIAQMKEERKKLAPDKAKFLKIVCTSDSLSMLVNKDDKRDMQEACLEFKYHGNPPHVVRKVKKTPRPTIFADKESPEEDEAPVKHKKSVRHKKVMGNHKENHKNQGKEEVAAEEQAANTVAEAAAAGAAAGAELETTQPMDIQPGQVIGAPQGNQADFGKALEASQGLIGNLDKSGKSQELSQGLSSFSSSFKSGSPGAGLGAFGGGE